MRARTRPSLADRRALTQPKAKSKVKAPKQPRIPRKDRFVARRVGRVVRNVDAWSVLKVSLIFYFCAYIVLMVAGILLWTVAESTGFIERIEGNIVDLGGYSSFHFEPGTILLGAGLGGLVLVIVMAGVNVLGAVLFNLISDLVGGVRLTVIEEETARRPVPDESATG